MPATTQPANPAARNTFDVRPLVGAHFNNPAMMRVESAAVAMEGRRLFVGTADGCVRVWGREDRAPDFDWVEVRDRSQTGVVFATRAAVVSLSMSLSLNLTHAPINQGA